MSAERPNEPPIVEPLEPDWTRPDVEPARIDPPAPAELCNGGGELVRQEGPRDRLTGEYAVEEWFVCPGCPACEDPMARDEAA